jgi:hypothetical protein
MKHTNTLCGHNDIMLEQVVHIVDISKVNIRSETAGP